MFAAVVEIPALCQVANGPHADCNPLVKAPTLTPLYGIQSGTNVHIPFVLAECERLCRMTFLIDFDSRNPFHRLTQAILWIQEDDQETQNPCLFSNISHSSTFHFIPQFTTLFDREDPPPSFIRLAFQARGRHVHAWAGFLPLTL